MAARAVLLQGWSEIAAEQGSGRASSQPGAEGGEAPQGATSTGKEQLGRRGAFRMLLQGWLRGTLAGGKRRVGWGLAEAGGLAGLAGPAGRAGFGPAQGSAPRRVPAVRGPGGWAAVYF